MKNLPIVFIDIMEGRPSEKIDQLIENVTDTISKTLDAPKENVRVIVRENPKTHWGIGGISAQNLGR